MITQACKTELARRAMEMRRMAYVPYSHFSVGAALLTSEGEIVTGCNVENASFPAGLCAERVAIFSAAAAGHRAFTAIAISGGKMGETPSDYCPPCGMCLQVMSEFCEPSFTVLLVKSETEIEEYQLKELLPYAFNHLKE